MILRFKNYFKIKIKIRILRYQKEFVIIYFLHR